MTELSISPDWTEQWDDCAPCEFCGSLVKEESIENWKLIETMPTNLWCYVFVSGAGMGFEAIKNSNGEIRSLHTGRKISMATHWRKSWSPPSGDLSANYDYVNLI